MRVLHVSMSMTDGKNSYFHGCILECRWTNKAKGKWVGKYVADTGSRYEFHDGTDWHEVMRLEAEESARLGIPSVHDTFGMGCPVCNRVHTYADLVKEGAA